MERRRLLNSGLLSTGAVVAGSLATMAGFARQGRAGLRLGGAAPTTVRVGWPTLYTLVNGASYRERLLELASDTPGLTLYSATFG